MASADRKFSRLHAHGMNRARQSEFLKTMTAGAFKSEQVAMASGALVDHAGDTETIDRYEAINIGVVPEQRLDAPEIAELLLADRADEHQVPNRSDLI